MHHLHREMEQANKSEAGEVAPECCCAKRSTATVAQGDGLSANDLFNALEPPKRCQRQMRSLTSVKDRRSVVSRLGGTKMIRRSLVTAALLIFASATALAQPMTKPDPGATIRSEPPPTSAGQAVGSCNSREDKPNSNFSCARLKAACEGAGYKYSPSKPTVRQASAPNHHRPASRWDLPLTSVRSRTLSATIRPSAPS